MDIKPFDPFKHISPDGMKKLIAEYGDEISHLREENKRMRDALRPFSDAIEWDDADGAPDNGSIWEHYVACDITFGNLRQARTALATTGGESSKPESETWIGKKVSDITDMKNGDVVWEDENGIVTRFMRGGE